MVSIEKQPLRRKLGLLEGQRGLGKEQRRKDQIAVVSFVTFILSAILGFYGIDFGMIRRGHINLYGQMYYT